MYWNWLGGAAYVAPYARLEKLGAGVRGLDIGVLSCCVNAGEVTSVVIPGATYPTPPDTRLILGAAEIGIF